MLSTVFLFFALARAEYAYRGQITTGNQVYADSVVNCFTPTDEVWVTHLGAFDSDNDGFADDATTITLSLASGTILAQVFALICFPSFSFLGFASILWIFISFYSKLLVMPKTPWSMRQLPTPTRQALKRQRSSIFRWLLPFCLMPGRAIVLLARILVATQMETRMGLARPRQIFGQSRRRAMHC